MNCSAVCIIINRIFLQIKEVDLDVSALDTKAAEMFSSFLPNIEMLKLRKITSQGMQAISDAINHASKPVIKKIFNVTLL